MEDIKEVYDFYEAGAEIGRLENGLGKIEFYRTKEIINSYLETSENLVVYDIGGGVGVYSKWLSQKGYKVSLMELSPNAVEYANKTQDEKFKYEAITADARNIPKPDESADAILLMGPLYHLQDEKDREQVLNECFRVLKKDGIIFIAGISKFSSTTWALSVFGNNNEFFSDDVYFNMLKEELSSGKHNRPEKYPFIISQAFFTTAKNMEKEVETCGFNLVKSHAIEGCSWICPNLSEKWEDVQAREKMLEIIHKTEFEESLIGISPHFLTVAKKI